MSCGTPSEAVRGTVGSGGVEERESMSRAPLDAEKIVEEKGFTSEEE